MPNCQLSSKSTNNEVDNSFSRVTEPCQPRHPRTGCYAACHLLRLMRVFSDICVRSHSVCFLSTPLCDGRYTYISHHNDNGHVALYDYVFGPHHATLTLLPLDDDGLTLMQLRHYRRGDTLSSLPHHRCTFINTHRYRLRSASALLRRTPRSDVGILLIKTLLMFCQELSLCSTRGTGR